MLGAYSQDLIAISAFFPQGLSQPVHNSLSESDKKWLLQAVSYCLMSLGRLVEAVIPREESLKLNVKLKDWFNASSSAQSLFDLLLLLGKLREAETIAQNAIDYSNNSKEKFKQAGSFCRLAIALHYVGKLKQAEQTFAQAENIWKEAFPDFQYLSSDMGAYYCALLLDTATNRSDIERIIMRGKYGLKISQEQNWLMDIAFDHLTLARAFQALQRQKNAITEFNLAVQGIQKAGTLHLLPKFYLARADFYLNQNDLLKREGWLQKVKKLLPNFYPNQNELDQAAADIKTANYTINRCGMNLYAVDLALLQARYCLALAIPDKKQAAQFCDKAEMLIEKTGYHLRDKVLAELKKYLK